ncbi:uncharacterized protein LOC131321415 isoform X2 [Rhododendron vialii]|uniref:uncharacterized protein LOC131321415 isoform X2 n=1 Tax=Rhododendron vialii TaxID=182163 RepID=UPI00265F30AC|nr:uncharacterized protein LOC131321415 isoform X2 [Rhododendron vialii]
MVKERRVVIVTWEEKKIRIRRREEKRRILGACSGGGGGAASVLPHELVVSEVLTRLACKPLARFKCVSNLWRSSIEDDCFRKPFKSEDHRGSLLQFGDHLALVEGFVDQKLELWVYGGKMPTEEEKRGGEQDVDVDVVDVADDYVDDGEEAAAFDIDVVDVADDYVDDGEEEAAAAAFDVDVVDVADDYVDDGEEAAAVAEAWTKHIINIPYAFKDRGCSLLGNLPTGEMLMTGTHVAQEEEGTNNSNSKSLPLVPVMPPLYSYDPTKEKFQELVIGNNFQTPLLPSIGMDSNKLHIYQYVEDIRPLENLIRGDESNLGGT